MSLRWKLFFSYVLISVIVVALLLIVTHLLTVIGVRATIADTSGIEAAAFIRAVDQGLAVAAVIALILAIALSNVFSRRIAQPITDLAHASAQIALGSYHVRVDVGTEEEEVAALSRAVNQLATALDQTERRRMALLSDVAHELRTPIMTIDSYAEGMIDGIIPTEQTNLALIQREATRMKRLIDDFSLLSRAEAGQISLNLQPIDLAAVIAYLKAQFRLQCEEEGLQLTINLPPDLPPVYADQQRIEQVLINVLVNAICYTPAGGMITVSAEQRPGTVRVVVRDTGIGIAPEHLALIFDRFYRVEASRSRNNGGAGVGLAIARHLMRAQHGDVWAESPGLGAGSSFVIVLSTTRPIP